MLWRTLKEASYSRCHKTHEAEVLKGTSAFNESPHHPSSASSHGSASEITHPYVFPYLQNKWSAADDGELSLFLGHEKNLFFLWAPHLSLSNIWLLVKTFLCLSWANIKNYITALLTTSVCVSKELYIQGGLVHIWTGNLTQWWAVMCPSVCPWRLYLTSRMDLITYANNWLGHPPLAVLLWRTAQGLTARKTPLGTLIQLELNAVKHETFFRPCCVGKRPVCPSEMAPSELSRLWYFKVSSHFHFFIPFLCFGL